MATWTGAAGTSDWFYIKHTHLNYPDDTVTSNWDVTPNTPGSGDSISIGSVYTVTNGSGMFGSLTLGTGGSLSTNGFFSVSSVSNGGAINVISGGAAYFVFSSGTATLTGGGSITLMSNDPQHYGAVLGYGSGALVLTNQDNTIAGGGSISGYRTGSLTLINNAVINATGNSSNLYGALTIDAAGGITNNGVLEATGNAGLVTRSAIDNRNGQIKAFDGAHVDLSGTVLGGRIATIGSGYITANNATFDGSNTGGIALSGTVNAAETTLNGAVSNAGIINVGTFQYLYTGSSGVTLSGGGSITLNANASQHYPSVIYGSLTGAATFTNVDNTISGSGSISDYRGNALTFVNGGTVNATGDSNNGFGALAIDASGGVINNNLFQASGASGLSLNSSVDNRNGRIVVLDGSRLDLTANTITGGSIAASGSGAINASNVTFDGSNAGGIALSGTINAAATTLNGAVSNAGVINVATFNYLYTGSGGATLSGGGSIVLHADAGQRYPSVLYGSQDVSATLTNIDNTISGGGSIESYRNNALTFVNNGTVSATGDAVNNFGGLAIYTTGGLINGGTIKAAVQGSSLTITTGRAVTNNGTLLAANGGTLTVSDAVTGTGTAQVSVGGTLSFASTFDEAITFSGANAGKVILAQAYSGTITGFGAGDTLDLTNLFYAAGETLTLQSAAAGTRTFALRDISGATLETLTFAGAYAARSFGLANDGSGYVAVTSTGPSKTPARGDFNADGVSDILFRNSSTGDFGYSTINQGGSGATYHPLGGSNAAYAIVGIGDFNADGTSDILYRNTTTGDFGYTKLNLDGTNSYVGLGGSNAAYAVAGIGDFNADGTSDILYRNNTTGDFGYSALDPATGGSTYKGLGGSNTAYAVAGIGDFNADGTSDILYRNNATGDFGYSALNASTGGSTYTGLGGSNTAYSVVGVGDFNGDGTSDILYRNSSSGDFGYSALDPATGGSAYTGLGLSNTAYNVVGTGDYNGDGLADVLFRNPTSGDLGYEQITAAGQGSYVSLGGSNASYAAY